MHGRGSSADADVATTRSLLGYRRNLGSILRKYALPKDFGEGAAKFVESCIGAYEIHCREVIESERHLRIFTTEDTREAFTAKVEKRKPRFRGR